jgi:2-dehydropantoate 2-reductase
VGQDCVPRSLRPAHHPPPVLGFARTGGTPIGLPPGEARTRHREEFQALVAEAAAVSRVCGGPADPAQAMARYDAFPPGAKSSMQRDAEAGRPLELDAIGGALLRAAGRHGVAVPVTARLVGELRAAGH